MDRGRVSISGSEEVRAFRPHPLPPSPPLELSSALQQLLESASVQVGRLDSVSTLLPDRHLFLYAYVRKEALLSSQIEGTQSSLSELLLFELDDVSGAPRDDVVEVSNYVAALEHGLGRVRDGFPMSKRLIREIHGKLMARGRGSEKSPGEFRRTQNWIGGPRPGKAHYVPPPADEVLDCMQELEEFLHADSRIPILVKAALAHVQFESIHPFLDGNGRVGRLLITLLLCSEGKLQEPMLYLSLYLKQHRDEYYDLLDRVRHTGAWEEWVEFFLRGVEDTARAAVETAQRLMTLFESDAHRVRDEAGLRASSALRVHESLRARPVRQLKDIEAETGLAFPTVSAGMKILTDAGIAREVTGKRRNRVFVYSGYLEILNEGTENL